VSPHGHREPCAGAPSSSTKPLHSRQKPQFHSGPLPKSENLQFLACKGFTLPLLVNEEKLIPDTHAYTFSCLYVI
jgi:hypothetical protein